MLTSDYIVNLSKWMTIAKPGDNYIYYTGWLVKDQQSDYELRKLADNVNKWVKHKLITVSHKKICYEIKNPVYHYIAFKLNGEINGQNKNTTS